MSVSAIVGNVKDLLSKVVNAVSLDEAKSLANQGLQEVQAFINKGERAIDPWLVRWAASSWSMPIAIGFGLALLAIGDLVNFLGVVFWLFALVF